MPRAVPQTRGESRRKLTEEDAARIREKRLEEWELYIGRGHPRHGLPHSKWANPFPVNETMTVEKSLERFRAYLKDSHLERSIGELTGKVLICHCRPEAQCHGDILLEMLKDRRAAGETADGVEDGLPVRLPADTAEEERRTRDVRSADEGANTGWVGRGLARRARTMGRERPFHDGGGLCSPGRWPSTQRKIPTWKGRDCFVALKAKLNSYWGRCKPGKGLIDLVLFLAAGRCKTDPFDEAFTRECLAILGHTLGMTEEEMSAEPGQCFRLRALSRLLALAGDPDWDFPLKLVDGVPLGVGVELPRTPAVFESKVKWALGDFDGDPERDRENYQTMAGHEDRVEELFREEAAQGWMEELYDADAEKIFKENLHVASLAVVDEGTKVRVVHDASNGVGINHRIRVLDQVRYPGAGEIKRILEERKGKGQRGFGILADASKAHRRVKVRPQDWGFQACRLRPGKVWINKVGTYGVGSAGYWWTRLAAAFHRLGFYLLDPGGAFESLLFADDWLAVGTTKAELEEIVVLILVMHLLGYPFNFKKFRGGDLVQWIGLEVNLSDYAVGISKSRAAWLRNWVAGVLAEGRVEVRDLVAVLGRFCFAMGPLEYLRPFLAPVFAWTAAVSGAGKLLLPWSIGFLLKFLADELDGTGRMYEIQLPGADVGEAFRSDAKAEGSTVVVGGWECRGGRRPRDARWFSVVLTRSSAPWAFSRGEPYRSIAALELFGTLLSIMAFAGDWPEAARGRFRLSGATDNQGNTWVLNRLMTTKFPMIVVLAELAAQLRAINAELSLEWIPRLQNEEADALTNEDFSAFRPELRVQLEVEQLAFLLLPRLAGVAEELHADILKRRGSGEGPERGARVGPAKKLKERDPWI